MPEQTYLQAVRDAIAEEMRRDETVVLFGEDVEVGYVFRVTKGLVEEFGPLRVRDTPISELAIAGAAVGAAMTGLRPVPEIQFVDFTTLAMDQIVNQAAKLRYMTGGQARVAMTLRAPVGPLANYAAQHSQSFHAFFCNVPGLVVAMPTTPADVKGLLKASIRSDDPVIFLEHKALYGMRGEVPEGEHLVPLGVAEVKRAGRDVTVVATGKLVHESLRAAEDLAREGIELEVVDPRTLYPLDTETILESVRRTGRLVIADEAPKMCGYAAEIAALAAEEALEYLTAPVKRVALAHAPMPCAPPLEEYVLVGAREIAQAAREAVAG
ncbi:alpha-ketoacid dehydrogenase subunit beta [Conexibacter sp. CPCC 206217]|uniref:alpha-ketoacid dehydrogenase subunit beta n=1 Tax=Conexibacter sp. CPCC 206217 TaxID=3064574 RepID=UPI00272924BB|nr:alpha-ketoacid dehydrogenase subunit beta [Conexibacter sp. CPCC 206217]MDO8211085.1 alpha-ketoacid dehydrogenase subunit beta [Conexibacter sp. CPCC 206217]